MIELEAGFKKLLEGRRGEGGISEDRISSQETKKRDTGYSPSHFLHTITKESTRCLPQMKRKCDPPPPANDTNKWNEWIQQGAAHQKAEDLAQKATEAKEAAEAQLRKRHEAPGPAR